MNRGEVWWVNFDPSGGGEIRKRRPAVNGKQGKAMADQLTTVSKTRLIDMGQLSR